MSVYLSSGKQHIPVGIIYEDESKNINEENNYERSFIFSDALDAEIPVVLNGNDKLIIFSSDY